MAKKKEDPDSELLQRIRDRRKQAEDAETWRQECLEDMIFCDPKRQWPENIRREREAEGRPCLTVDRIGAFRHQLINDFRQNRQSIRVQPVGDGADIETAKIRQGLIRHIEYDSTANIAYDTAFEGQAMAGFGFVRIYTEYETPESFNQVLKIGMIPNQFMVHVDPASVMPDGSDSNWAFVEEDLTREAYNDAYPESRVGTAGARDWETIGATAPTWISKDSVRVADYYERTRVKKTITNPETGETRDSYDTIVKIYKTNGVEILDRSDWVEEHIPVVPFYGETLLIDGKLTHSGLVRSAKDPAMLFNFMKTAQAEAIALTPKAPYIGPFAAKAGFEKDWAASNRKNQDYLPYNHVDDRGNKIPAPQRQFAQADIGAITKAMMGCENDMKAAVGMYDANLGNREGSQSGVAIRNLAAQGQTGNFHFQDNFNRSLCHVGRILNNAIPKVYDNARIMRIIKEDDSQEMVGINGAQPEDGQDKTYDLTQGRYDVIVTAGPSYATKRAENLAVMIELSKVIPGFAEIGGDLMVSQMDTPIARQIQERLKKALPPQFQDKKPGQDELPPEVMQKMQQYEQMIEQMTEALNKAHDSIDQKTLELDVKRDVALIQQKTELIKVIATMEGQAAHTMLAHELKQAQASIDAYGFGSGTPSDPEMEQAPVEEMPMDQPMEEMPLEEPIPEEPMEPEEYIEPEPPPPTPQEIHDAHMVQALENQSAALGAIAEALGKLSAPKRLITDKAGRPVGVETVSNG